MDTQEPTAIRVCLPTVASNSMITSVILKLSGNASGSPFQVTGHSRENQCKNSDDFVIFSVLHSNEVKWSKYPNHKSDLVRHLNIDDSEIV